MIQQYQFLSRYLQELSDELGRRQKEQLPFYEPEVTVYGNRPEAENGDRSLCWAGTGCKYYVLLCDGMGTGLGAVQEGRTAGERPGWPSFGWRWWLVFSLMLISCFW